MEEEYLSGKAGKAFIKELTRLFQAYADESPLECIALKACSVMQCLLLQKPHARSKTKEHIACLERRMVLWSEGKIEKLISEGKYIQKHLTSNTTAEMEMEKIARGFNRLMLQGKGTASGQANLQCKQRRSSNYRLINTYRRR